MFESVERQVVGDDARSCADALADSVPRLRRAAATRMAQVARWADLHVPAPGRAGARPGGDGTPEVTLFAATELGCLLQTTTCSARMLLADVLDLRHRLPRSWQAVMTGQLEDYRARHLARATRAAGLSLEQARQVDTDCLEALTGLPWGRAMNVVEAAVTRADPAGHRRRREQARDERYVSLSRRDTETGLRTLIARTTAGDIARLDAMVDHLAELLRAQGDADCRQQRRAKAVAILADPAAACLLLARGTQRTAAHDIAPDSAAETEPDTDSDAEPEPEPEAPYVSPVDAASRLGRILAAHGATALARLRPRTVIYLHLTDAALRSRAGVARAEGIGPVCLDDLAELRELIGRDAVTVTPVLDLAGQTPVDAYEVPASMRSAMVLRHPYEVFPWGTQPSRAADLDHTVAWRDPGHGGPPGPTGTHNLGPLSRAHHNAKTHHGFVLHQPVPGVYLWRTPTGHWYQVDAHGSHALGRAAPLPQHQRRPRRLDQVTSPLEIQLAGLLTG